MNNLTQATKPKIFTWHIHGSYLFYLSQGNYEIFIPVKEERTEGYYGRGETLPFGNNVHEVHVSDIPKLDLDCIIFNPIKIILTINTKS